MKAIQILAITCPAIFFLLCWAIYKEIPSTSVFSADTMIFQYIMTMLTIVCIPGLLWFVRKDRLGDKFSKAFYLRIAIFLALTLINIFAFFYVPNVTFFYLGAMTYIAIFFALNKNK